MAGVIAHHFNNQLGAVMGNLELAMIDLPSGSDVQASLAEAMKASQRAAEVTDLITNAWEAVGDGQGTIHLTVKTVSSADIPTSHRFPISGRGPEPAGPSGQSLGA
jgi:hypothetical protein